MMHIPTICTNKYFNRLNTVDVQSYALAPNTICSLARLKLTSYDSIKLETGRYEY